MQWMRTQDEEGKRHEVWLDVRPGDLVADPKAPNIVRPPYWISRFCTIPTQYRVRVAGSKIWRRVYKLDPSFPRPAHLQGKDLFYVHLDNKRALVRLNQANRYVMENVGRFI